MRCLVAIVLAGPTLLAPLAPAFAHAFEAGDIKIVHPWSRATPGGAQVGAGYLKLENKGGEADRLIAVESPVAKAAEIHEMSMEGSVMKMREIKGGLEIPAGGTVELKPGGMHLMFVGLKQPIVEGEPFEATLTFEKAGTVQVTFKVEKIGAMSSGDADAQHHDHGDDGMSGMEHHDHH